MSADLMHRATDVEAVREYAALSLPCTCLRDNEGHAEGPECPTCVVVESLRTLEKVEAASLPWKAAS